MFSAARSRPVGPPTQRPGRQIALLLITAMVSFALGMTVGRNTAPVPQVVKVKVPVNRSEVGQEKLTFYNTLPRGETPALGSGINRPAQPTSAESPVAAVQASTVSHPAQPPATALEPKGGGAKATATPSEEKKTPPVAKSTATEKGKSAGWILQTASFPKENDARTFGKKLQNKGYKTRIEATEVKGKTWYRVYVGPYQVETAARQAAAALDKERVSAIVRKL